MMQRFLKKPIIAIVILALAGGYGAWRWHAQNGPKLSFRTAIVKRGDVATTISATGTIEPVEVVDVGAQVAGQISSFGKDKDGKTIDYGSVVEEGGILAKIDESVYTAELSVARAQMEQDKADELSAAANIEQVKAKLLQAGTEWDRAQALSAAKLISGSDFDSFKSADAVAKANVAVAEAALARAKASTVQAQAAIDKAQRNLDFCTIKSPVKGVIIDRRVNIGQTVVSSLNAPSLFLIANDLTKMQIWVAVNEADIGRIVCGGPATFACDTFPDREFAGTVGKVRLNATMTQNVVMYTVEVNTENPDNILLPYLTANVHFIVKKDSNALLVPNAALRWNPSSLAQIAPDFRSWKSTSPAQEEPHGESKPARKDENSKQTQGLVWVKDGEFVRPMEVKCGASDGASTAVVTDGLREGQEVVTGETAENTQTGTQNPFLPPVRKR
ncbi:efflux RND transporter periplasmic adaptor subunit [Pedosphaera parvula]|uniref:Efflux transporter, RND family, MFP subunit n=1 Tax=Pedosphaera parvula (strain Ellin514) TaxID=320771 RepID=B9XKQ9_PEDPL|nr:efflux RND transporter periplasmic adaptor subunit [Pedosphaera parvula]EEF59552.1 efflux transporter, RND family, MFP subunit [Pedosphaera parvula Ellin514]